MHQKKKLSREKKAEYLIGLDLAGSPKNKTGICLANPSLTDPKIDVVYSDEEIESFVSSIRYNKGNVIAVIDAPLTWSGEPYRGKDKEAARHGARLLPMNLSGMRILYERAKQVMEIIWKSLVKVEFYETHPSSLAKLLGYSSTLELAKKYTSRSLSKDEADALACCVAGKLLLEGKAVLVGDKFPLILPRSGGECFFVFDVDGVLIDNSERVYRAKAMRGRIDFYSRELMLLDKPREPGIKALLDRLNQGKVIILTGRPIRVKKQTMDQLSFFGIPLKRIHRIFFRDTKEDPIQWKKEKLIELSQEYIICEVHEDEEEVLEMVKRKIPSSRTLLHKGSHILEY